ncbi:hypothetical protein D1007_11669 [Hordeum vulgare]|nr:hypothetical protein D1007_11669 [Hordeum vulgare]
MLDKHITTDRQTDRSAPTTLNLRRNNMDSYLLWNSKDLINKSVLVGTGAGEVSERLLPRLLAVCSELGPDRDGLIIHLDVALVMELAKDPGLVLGETLSRFVVHTGGGVQGHLGRVRLLLRRRQQAGIFAPQGLDETRGLTGVHRPGKDPVHLLLR